MAHKSPPMHLFVDFDSTLTMSPTLTILANINDGARPDFDQLSAVYMNDMKAHSADYEPQAFERTTLTSELAYLSSLAQVELDSIRRCEAAGTLELITDDYLDQKAIPRIMERGQVQFRNGWKELFENVLEAGGRVDILSTSWSASFIYRILAYMGISGKGEAGPLSQKGSGGIGVLANEFKQPLGKISRGRHVRWVKGVKGDMLEQWKVGYLEDQKGYKEDSPGIWTADGKVDVMNQALKLVWGEEHKPLTVFIGDSVTDLGAMASADVGICIRGDVKEAKTGEKKELTQVLERIGLMRSWIGDLKVDDLKLKEDKNKESETIGWERYWSGSDRTEQTEVEGEELLWWALDFEEISKVFFT